jgi:TonB family protein
MAILSVPIKFQIFKGNQLVREEVLKESVIKIGKLASSHLRLDDETVSRMHAVVEVVGPGKVELIDLGSTRGTTVNGERITKATLKPGDQIDFGNARVVVTFSSEVEVVEATPPVAVLAFQAAAMASPAPRPLAHVPRQAVAQTPLTVQPFAAPAGGHANADTDVLDGSKAIEVQTIYRGIVTNTRHLIDATGKSTTAQTRAFLGASVVFILIALATFFSAIATAGHEKAKYEQFLTAGGDSKNFQWTRSSPALDFMVLGGFAIGISLAYMGLKRRGETTPNFIIGSDAKADAPVGQAFIGVGAFPLVSTTGTDFLVNVTPAMSGEVHLDGQSVPLAQLIQQRGPSFSLGERGLAKIDCGATTFLVHATSKPRPVPVPFLVWRWAEQAYTVGTTTALLLFLLMIFSVPPDPKSLSLDLFNADSGFVGITIKPPVEKEEEMPSWLQKKGPEEQGGKGKRHNGDEGTMGKKTAKNKEGLVAIKGPKDNQDQYLAKKLAEENAKSAGILGALRAAEGSHLASIFGRETAMGSDSANILGGLIGAQIGEAYGLNGLALVGTGSGGGGTGEGTLGLGNFGTFGKGGGGGDGAGYGSGGGAGYGRAVGGLAPRRARAPEIIPGQADVRGSLDKEIIRRIIRRHINEVRFCYESELTKKATLSGRISVQFTISGTGQVIASVLQSSTMENVHVESCVVQAVRRWEFPKPEAGGIVIVSYPFNFSAGGAGQ